MGKGLAVVSGTITGIIIIAMIECLLGLIVWGIGSLVIFAFGIDFQFTYLMALAVVLVLDILSLILGK